MKINCLNQALTDNINIVTRALSTRTTMDILECILIIAEEGTLRLFASNLEMSIETDAIAEAEIIEEGRVVIDGRMLGDIVRRLNQDKMVSISTEAGNVIKIECDKSEFKLLGLNPDEYPSLPFVEHSHVYRLNASLFKNLLRQTIYCAAQDNVKPVFTGALIEHHHEGEHGTISVVALDGVRMAHSVHELSEGDKNATLKMIVPAKSLAEILKIIGNDDDFISFYATDKHALFQMKGATLVTRLIEGDFIDYKQIFNVEHSTLVTCERQTLLAGLERAALIAVKETRKSPVRLDIAEDVLKIASNAQIGTVNEELDIDLDGNPLEIGFNPRYLIEALKVIESEFVTLSFNSSLSPCIIKSSGNTNSKHLVLPLRLDG